MLLQGLLSITFALLSFLVPVFGDDIITDRPISSSVLIGFSTTSEVPASTTPTENYYYANQEFSEMPAQIHEKASNLDEGKIWRPKHVEGYGNIILDPWEHVKASNLDGLDARQSRHNDIRLKDVDRDDEGAQTGEGDSTKSQVHDKANSLDKRNERYGPLSVTKCAKHTAKATHITTLTTTWKKKPVYHAKASDLFVREVNLPTEQFTKAQVKAMNFGKAEPTARPSAGGRGSGHH
ncbi:hypothetical protein K505DRAFT_356474 [Melanomma pulvis-pyrius CBS 109.77]|uniref:Uncharacterized protein n=1 Tax=Melanomma pulvis-pyrius CBS 109.77 TaxID=1314802 RepID=A0A6A6XT08_9PLEO|nr:hypothetical protein K505DRAFT_356474 [Melanomma pulvis-pyrius CBS 109.77]